MKKRKPDLFTGICLILMMAVVCFVGGTVLLIAIRGFSVLPEHLREKETIFALFLSMKTALISSLGCFIFAVPTAYVLTHIKIPFRGMIEILLELTMTLPYIVLGLSLLILFSSPMGKALKEAGFPVVFDQNGIVLAQLAVNLPFGIKLVTQAFQSVDSKQEAVAGLLGATPFQRFYTILLPLCKNALNLPFGIKLVTQAFQSVDSKQEAVAGLLGATPFQRFYTILLPLCKNALVSAFILIWSRALGEFGATLMLVGVTRMKTETLPGNIYLNVSTNNLEGALASAFLLLLLAAAALLISNRITRMDRRGNRYAQENA